MPTALPALNLIAEPGRRRATLDTAREIERHPGRLRFSELPEGIDDPQLGCHPRSGSPSAASSSAVSGCVPPQEKGETSDLLRLTAVFPSLRLNTSTITGVGCLGKLTNRVIRLSHPLVRCCGEPPDTENRPARRSVEVFLAERPHGDR
jgi:hypothetical protein